MARDKTVALSGIDLAKNVFQLHGASVDGQAVLKRRVRREGLLAEIAELGRVDKRHSHGAAGMIQAGFCYGDQLGTRLDVGRGMGVL